VGLDGLEPSIAEALIVGGELPHLARLGAVGSYRRLGTTLPAQTPVAWSTFATGVNPGGHGIFDFLTRDPETYLPTVGLNRHVQRSAFLPPKAQNLRGGTPVWDVLTQAGVSSAVVRCPCTYPPDRLQGRMLSGMGVPDLRGSFGTPTFFTSDATVKEGESETVVYLAGEGSVVRTALPGPRNPKTGEPATVDLTIAVCSDTEAAVTLAGGAPLELRAGEWSGWCKVRFKLGALQSVRGMVRFHLVRTGPALELYASPVNYDPHEPWFPISHPWEYAGELEKTLGGFYTTGMVEEHTGLINGRIDEAAFLAQCDQVMDERERMLLHELGRQPDGLVFCLFDTPDRLQHMFWRFREPDHPANAHHDGTGFERAIEDLYRRCDATVGRVLEAAGDDETLVIVLSDHGFGSFRRGVSLNTWLHREGLLTLRDGVAPGPDAGELFETVDWSRTQAYALGLGGIYLNLAGREGQGIVDADDADALRAQIIRGLSGLVDEQQKRSAIRSVVPRELAYAGEYVDRAPDLLVNCEPGYRASWATPLGGVTADLFEDNVKRWSGDHVVAPEAIPGVLYASAPIASDAPRMVDLAPTILHALGVPALPVMEGASLIL
jgi:predicted AlkP superfamily phosphohydrolase/phosphomutase